MLNLMAYDMQAAVTIIQTNTYCSLLTWLSRKDFIVEYCGNKFIVEYRICTVDCDISSSGYITVWHCIGREVNQVFRYELVETVEYMCYTGKIMMLDYIALREEIVQKIGKSFCCFFFQNFLGIFTELLFVNTGI